MRQSLRLLAFVAIAIAAGIAGQALLSDRAPIGRVSNVMVGG